ncbi:aldehyde dehydrogenase [Candidatus Thioglobus sp.]|jgi:gamma-glutamyl-gamma-aminobutyraldehyde dehydrogenase|nr:aldehyde dehydrogenase [Candidatus Thioglobus sp.]MDC0483529.1 aldehyde dehydrogenase [Candidatus Thioglobus sp.]
MSGLLTHEEYKAIEKSLDFPTNAFINGQFQSSKSGNTFETTNPATGKVIANIAACNSEDVDHAVTKAREAFDQGHWSKLHPSERKEGLIKLSKLIKRNIHELAVMESVDSGKPIRDCETIDLPETIACLLWHAEAVDKIYDQTAPAGEDALGVIVREPVGVVGCVLPWNFPLLMMAWKIAPALAAGNSVIVKPAEQTSLTALRLAELAIDAGIPRGVLNVIPGLGPDVGEPIGLHPDVDMVSFTGSTETGRRFLRYSADSNLKKIVLECGGKNPAIVLDDAEDLDLVAEHIVNAAFWNMGENCSAASRLIVQENIKDALLEKMLAHLRDWKTGDPLNPSNYLGSLVDSEHFKKVTSYLKNDNMITGGKTEKPNYVLPTIFDHVDPNSKLAQEEIFGPILSVITVKTLDEAIAVANNTEYGLTASVFTANGKKAIRAARAIKAGTVTVNCYGEGDMSTPFGGYKQSGFGGRDNSIHAHDQYTELKTIWIDLSDRAPEESVD